MKRPRVSISCCTTRRVITCRFRLIRLRTGASAPVFLFWFRLMARCFLYSLICWGALQARLYLMRALVPAGEVLSLACPRESTQREGPPGATHRYRQGSVAALPVPNPLRSSPIRGPRTTRRFAGLKPAPQNTSDRVRGYSPDWLRYSGECYGSCRSKPPNRYIPRVRLDRQYSVIITGKG